MMEMNFRVRLLKTSLLRMIFELVLKCLKVWVLSVFLFVGKWFWFYKFWFSMCEKKRRKILRERYVVRTGIYKNFI